MTLVVASAAEQDAADAVMWYDAQREGLGDEFLQALWAALEMIESFPTRFPVVTGKRSHRAFRQALLSRFPYRVIFELQTDDVCVVLAIVHVRRHPDAWRERMEPEA